MMSDGLKDQTMNRRKYDGCKTGDDLRVTTGPGRYQLNVPVGYCDASFAPEPTVRQQKWGASLNAQYTKTDVESDLLNLNRPTTKATCNQYNPQSNRMNSASTETVKESSFPQTHTRLVDPPCTGRASGWNRWEWLCDNPQDNVMVPFDNMVTTRLQQKDQFRPCIPTPVDPSALLPAPRAHETGSPFQDADEHSLAAAVAGMMQQFPRGADSIPAAPTALTGVHTNPVNPPSVAFAPY
jgi:hypothetical protein